MVISQRFKRERLQKKGMTHEFRVKIGKDELVVKKESDGPVAGVYQNGNGVKATDFIVDQKVSIADLASRVYFLEVAHADGNVVVRNTHKTDSLTSFIVGPDNAKWVRTMFPEEKVVVPHGSKEAAVLINDSLVQIVQTTYDLVPKAPMESAPKIEERDKNMLAATMKMYNERFVEQIELFFDKLGITSGEQYEKQYWAGKTALNWRANQVLRENRRLPRALISDFLVKYHTHLDEDRFASLDEKTAGLETTVEVKNAGEIYQNDLLPGRSFVLGDQSTYGRELLQISRKSPLVHNALIEARIFASMSQTSMNRIIAREIFADFREKYAEGQDDDVAGGVAKTIGGFMEEGGCCRHRSSALTLVLQEAGVQAQYVQGFFIGRPHAWVQVIENESPVLLLDPNMRWDKSKARGDEIAVDRNDLKKDGDLWRYSCYSWPEYVNTVWRAKPKF